MNRTLGLWTKLLIAEYGRDRVIAALAEIENVEFDAIEREIQAHKQRKIGRRYKQSSTLSELLKNSNLDPKKLALINQIGCAYENKKYLPELWQAKRFLDSRGIETRNIRSRIAALPLIVKVLSNLSADELTDLAAGSSKSARGDLGIIADQILGSANEKSGVIRSVRAGKGSD